MDNERQGRPSALCPFCSKKNMILVALAALIIGIAIGYIYWGSSPVVNENAKTFEIDNNRLIKEFSYISEYYSLAEQGNPVFEIENATMQGDLIKVQFIEKTTKTKGTYYFTKNYEFVPTEPIVLSNLLTTIKEQIKAQEEEEKLANKEIPKTEKPKVELFVMSHCPYGTQAEKGIIPAIEALGNKVDFKIRFVYYAMHGETEVKEQLNQYCIQKEQEEKYISYLKCFLDKGDGSGCIASTGIDKEKLETCTKNADSEFKIMENFNNKNTWLSGKYPLFNTDKELNSKYNIGGSPTLVINDIQSTSGRDSASYLNVICNAFSEKPEECNKQLSNTAFQPGFGYAAGTSGTNAQCS